MAARCTFGHPTVAVSPSRLADGTPFPTYAWLTCPHLVELAGSTESGGATAGFAGTAADDADFADRLRALDERVRTLRALESGGVDACSAVGLGGQRDPLGVKCLHVHLALGLLGEDDPIAAVLLSDMPRECDDDRCAAACGGRADGGPS